MSMFSIVACLALALVANPCDTASLLDLAKPVGKAEDTIGWISNDEILTITFDQAKRQEILARINVKTCRTDILAKLNHRIYERGYYAYEARISPDGKWLLWNQVTRDRDTVAVIAATDDSKLFEVSIKGRIGTDYPVPNPVYWSKRKDRWYEFASSDGTNHTNIILERRRSDNRVLSRIGVSAACQNQDTDEMLRQLRDTNSGPVYLSEEAGHMRIVSFRVNGEIAISADRELKRTDNGEPDLETICPDGTQVCWVVREGKKQDTKDVLYAANLSTESVRAVGYLSPRISKVSGEPELERTIRALHWSSDGNRLSFIYHDRLFVLPIGS